MILILVKLVGGAVIGRELLVFILKFVGALWD